MTSIGNLSPHPKHPARAFGGELAAEEGRALAHSNQPVSLPLQLLACQHRVGDNDLDCCVSECKLDPSAARPVAGGVRERLLHDPIHRLISSHPKWSLGTWCLEYDFKARGGAIRDQCVQRR